MIGYFRIAADPIEKDAYDLEKRSATNRRS